MTDELDNALLDVAKSAARRTLALIDQNKVPGYRRCTGYEDGNPERRDMGPLGGMVGAVQRSRLEPTNDPCSYA